MQGATPRHKRLVSIYIRRLLDFLAEIDEKGLVHLETRESWFGVGLNDEHNVGSNVRPAGDFADESWALELRRRRAADQSGDES